MDDPLRCSKCGLLLGYQTDSEVRIKWRDFYLTLTYPAWVKVSCRRCGYMSTVFGEEVHFPQSARTDVDWLCSNCGSLLGRFAAEGIELRMKCRDLYVIVGEAERVLTLCRKCGKVNYVSSSTN